MADHPFGGLSAAEALAGAEEAQRILRQAGTEAIVSREVAAVDRQLRREMPVRWWLARRLARAYRWCDEHPVALWLVVSSVIVATGLALAVFYPG